MSNAALLTLAARPNCGQVWRTGNSENGFGLLGEGETTPNSRKNSFVARFPSNGRRESGLELFCFFCIFRHSFCELEIDRNFRRGTNFLVTSRAARLPFCELKEIRYKKNCESPQKNMVSGTQRLEWRPAWRYRLSRRVNKNVLDRILTIRQMNTHHSCSLQKRTMICQKI